MAPSNFLPLVLVVLLLMLLIIRLLRSDHSKNRKLLRIRHQLNKLESEDPHEFSLEETVSKASRSELEILINLISKELNQPKEIAKSIRILGSHDAARFVRWIRGQEPNVSYYEIVKDVSKYCKASANSVRISDLEKDIVESIFKTTYSKLTEQEKATLDEFIKKESDQYAKKLKGVGIAAGSMLAMKVSGFGVYLMASTLVGGITHALGTTLPFVFYTGMSSTISVILGPIGWSLLAAWGLHKLGSPNKKKTLQSVIVIGCIRQRLINSWELQLAQLRMQEADLKAELVKNQYHSTKLNN